MFTLSPPFWAAEDGDPYWSYVKLLLHFDGDYVDSSPVAGAYGGGGGATITTTNQRFGSGGLDCTAGTDAEVAGGSIALAMGTGDFCIECYFKDPNTPSANTFFWFLQSASTTQTIRMFQSGGGQITIDNSGVGPGASVAYSYDTWYHAAVTRSGTSFTFWLNGAAALTWTNSTLNMPGIINVRVGKSSSAGTGRRAYIDEFRLTVGVPRYTAPFTPTGPFPNKGL